VPFHGRQLIVSVQRSALFQLIESFRHNPACKIELCIVYKWRFGDSGVPLKAFQFTSHHQWALHDNLVPIDEGSVNEALHLIRTSQTAPIPDFDLAIRYFDVRCTDQAACDLVNIRYRRAGTDDRDQTSSPHMIAGDLECDFHRRRLNCLHRYSWICKQEPSLFWAIGPVAQERLEELKREYAIAYGGSEDNFDCTCVERCMLPDR
jgi:hypothetical protein